MEHGSVLDPDKVPAGEAEIPVAGHAPRSMGPSDSSDSGSDLSGDASRGDLSADDDSDRNGTGERLSAGNPDIRVAADIAPDRIVDAEEAGLGGGLDQAEEAQLGTTDEEISARRRRS